MYRFIRLILPEACLWFILLQVDDMGVWSTAWVTYIYTEV